MKRKIAEHCSNFYMNAQNVAHIQNKIYSVSFILWCVPDIRWRCLQLNIVCVRAYEQSVDVNASCAKRQYECVSATEFMWARRLPHTREAHSSHEYACICVCAALFNASDYAKYRFYWQNLKFIISDWRLLQLNMVCGHARIYLPTRWEKRKNETFKWSTILNSNLNEFFLFELCHRIESMFSFIFFCFKLFIKSWIQILIFNRISI